MHGRTGSERPVPFPSMIGARVLRHHLPTLIAVTCVLFLLTADSVIAEPILNGMRGSEWGSTPEDLAAKDRIPLDSSAWARTSLDGANFFTRRDTLFDKPSTVEFEFLGGSLEAGMYGIEAKWPFDYPLLEKITSAISRKYGLEPIAPKKTPRGGSEAGEIIKINGIFFVYRCKISWVFPDGASIAMYFGNSIGISERKTALYDRGILIHYTSAHYAKRKKEVSADEYLRQSEGKL